MSIKLQIFQICLLEDASMTRLNTNVADAKPWSHENVTYAT